MSYSVVSGVFYSVKRLFTWAPDSETFGKSEHWADFADSVKNGETFRGDCDDFALTCLIVGIDRGVFKPELCRIARVATEVCPEGRLFDHAIAIYGDYMLDNRQRKPMLLSDAMRLYRFYDYAEIPVTDWYLYEMID